MLVDFEIQPSGRTARVRVVRKRTTVRDAASGFRAFSRDAALRLQVYGRYSYTMETLVQAKAEGLAVVGVPVPRSRGRPRRGRRHA